MKTSTEMNTPDQAKAAVVVEPDAWQIRQRLSDQVPWNDWVTYTSASNIAKAQRMMAEGYKTIEVRPLYAAIPSSVPTDYEGPEVPGEEHDYDNLVRGPVIASPTSAESSRLGEGEREARMRLESVRRQVVAWMDTADWDGAERQSVGDKEGEANCDVQRRAYAKVLRLIGAPGQNLPDERLSASPGVAGDDAFAEKVLTEYVRLRVEEVPEAMDEGRDGRIAFMRRALTAALGTVQRG